MQLHHGSWVLVNISTPMKKFSFSILGVPRPNQHSSHISTAKMHQNLVHLARNNWLIWFSLLTWIFKILKHVHVMCSTAQLAFLSVKLVEVESRKRKIFLSTHRFSCPCLYFSKLRKVQRANLLTRSRAELESTASRWLLAEDRPRVGNAGARDGSKNSWLR